MTPESDQTPGSNFQYRENRRDYSMTAWRCNQQNLESGKICRTIWFNKSIGEIYKEKYKRGGRRKIKNGWRRERGRAPA